MDRAPRFRRVELVLVALLFAGGLALRLAVVHDYVFAGSDSYGYIKLADEWRSHGRYALAPAPAPLHFGRLPLYPAFIALVKGSAPAEMSGGSGWGRITHAQLVLDLCVTCLFTWLIARRLAGWIAGLIALALVCFSPFHAIQIGSALTESTATALTTAAVAVLILWRHRPRAAFAVAGALTALCTLIRPDGALAALAWLPALWQLRPRRQQLVCAALAGGVALLVFAPWPLRNLVRFGQAWTFGCHVDRHSNPVLYWEGPRHFMRSFGRTWQDYQNGTNCAYDRGCWLGQWGEDATDSPDEKAALDALLHRQAREGLTPAVSAEYERLARVNFRRHPLRNLIALPLTRSLDMWTSSFDEMFQKPPLGQLYVWLVPVLPPLAWWLAFTFAAAMVVLLLDPSTRADGAILAGAIVGRTWVLAFMFYSMTRYVREVQPLSYAVIGAGVVVAGRALARRLRALRAARAARAPAR